MPEPQLTMDERYVISHMHWAGYKPAQIARRQRRLPAARHR
jgi:hypothetical protein